MLGDLAIMSDIFDFCASSALSLPRFRGTGRSGFIRYEHPDGAPADAPPPHAGAALAETALERNVFAAPWMTQAAGAYLTGGEQVRMLVSRAGSEVAGILPVVVPRRKLPLGVATVWAHIHSFETTPLVKADEADRFLDDLFAWLDRHRIAVLRWPRLSLEGAFAERLFRYLQRTGRRSGVIASHSRPLLHAGGGEGGTAVDQILSGKRRREINRCRRRLGEIGALSFRTMETLDEGDWWASEFLRLEASGWKGEGGSATALSCNGKERAFFLQTFHEAAERGQLVAHSLQLDGTPIAMTINYRCREAVWAYKTAYDERYARFAPGALLEVEGTQAMMDDPSIRWVDSCSDGDNALIRELWPGERKVGDLVVAVRPGRSLAFAAYVAGERAQSAARDRLRSVYWRLADWRQQIVKKHAAAAASH